MSDVLLPKPTKPPVLAAVASQGVVVQPGADSLVRPVVPFPIVSPPVVVSPTGQPSTPKLGVPTQAGSITASPMPPAPPASSHGVSPPSVPLPPSFSAPIKPTIPNQVAKPSTGVVMPPNVIPTLLNTTAQSSPTKLSIPQVSSLPPRPPVAPGSSPPPLAARAAPAPLQPLQPASPSAGRPGYTRAKPLQVAPVVTPATIPSDAILKRPMPNEVPPAASAVGSTQLPTPIVGPARPGGTLPPLKPVAATLPSAAGAASTPTLPLATTAATPPKPPTPAVGAVTAKSTTPPSADLVKPAKGRSWLPLIISSVVAALLILGGLGWWLFSSISGSRSSSASNSSQMILPASSDQTGPSTVGKPGGSTITSQPVVLQYWGLWEPSEALTQVIADYQAAHPGVSIAYTKQSHKNYRTRLQAAVASGNGPDIFRYHASWVPMLKTELAPLPSAVMSSAEYQQTFYPVAAKQLQVNGTPVGIPLMYDGIALFYNKEILATAVMTPPKTWPELMEMTKPNKLTILDSNGVKRGGVALGASTNVDHFSDVLALLLLQNKADLTKPSSPETRDALKFYTSFVTANKSWDATMPPSVIAFARGDVAMMFAPSWRAFDIQAQNPQLQFATVPVPQLDAANKVTWANYWAEGVSTKSKQQKESWEFLKYLSTKEVQQKLYATQAQTRPFGEIYSRVDLASSLAADAVTGSFVADAPKSQGWYLSSATHDEGINDEIIKYYADAVTATLAGGDMVKIQATLEAGVNSVLKKYGLPVSSTTTAPAGTTTGGTTR